MKKMPKTVAVEELFKKQRTSCVYFESWKVSKTKHDPLITKWAKHIEKSTKKTR